jgi:hypothetical protein
MIQDKSIFSSYDLKEEKYSSEINYLPVPKFIYETLEDSNLKQDTHLEKIEKKIKTF